MSNPAVPRRSGRRGLVVIFSMAVLAMLSMMALTLVQLTRIERSVSRNQVDLVRARMLAMSGVERAVAGLSRAGGDPSALEALRYFGEDLNGNGLADPGEDADGGGWEGESCPLHRAPRPSFMSDLDGDGRLTPADQVDVGGARLGASGLVAGTYAATGDLYAVRVTDECARIHVNMPAHPHLQAMLENLAEEAGLARAVGTRLFLNRPFSSLAEVQDRCGLSAAEFRTIRELITIHGWADRKVVSPVPLSGRVRPGLRLGDHVYTWEEVRPRRIDFPRDVRGKVVGRFPVNVNVAPREVLVALLRGLCGFYLDEERGNLPVNSGYAFLAIKYSYTGECGSLGRLSSTPPITAQQARDVADAVLARRRAAPFRSWQDVRGFLLDGLCKRGILDRRQIDVLLANFNPNSGLNDFGPEAVRFGWVDKTDLLYWTTELSFHGTGYDRVESIGRVLDESGAVVAESELTVHLKTLDLYRETTQQDFLHDHWKDGVPIESGILSREGGPGKTDRGLALATFPEVSETEWVKDADYDGYVALATKRNEAWADFRAHFSDGLESETGQTVVPDTNGPFRDRLVDQAGNSPGWRPGKIFPDGVYSEVGSVPMYDFRPSAMDRFAVSMWIKPHFFPERASKARVFLTWQAFAGPGASVGVLPLGIYGAVSNAGGDERSLGGYEYNEPWDVPALLAGGTAGGWAGGCATPCLNHVEHDHPSILRCGESWGSLFEGGKWMHVGWVHDGRSFVNRKPVFPGTLHEDMDVLFINGRRAGGLLSRQSGDVRTPTAYAGELLRLGERADARWLNSVPDGVIDDVHVWDKTPGVQGERRVLDAFSEGRYYGEDDGVFTSRAIDFARETGRPAGSKVRLAWLNWTAYVPDSLPQGRVVVDLVRASDGGAVPGVTPSVDSGGARMDLVLAGPVRYVVHFEPRTGGTAPVMETIVFDDITFVLAHAPQYLGWSWSAP